MKEIRIGHKIISDSSKPFIVAEFSANHDQSIDRALQMVEAASDAGADAIKLQTYTPDTMTIKKQGGLFDIGDKNSLWYKKNLYELYAEAQTPWQWHETIFNKAKEKGLIAFSSAFDSTSVDFLESLQVPCYKIASYENNDLPLLKKIAGTGKPVIISTGASELNEIYKAVDTLKNNGCKDIIMLKCTSVYPALPETVNLQTLADMKHRFDVQIGLSDHTPGIGVSVAAVSLGAKLIEKHFTLSRADKGVDSAFSIEPDELKQLVKECNNAYLALGKVSYDLTPAEAESRKYKRSVYVIKDIKKGEAFTPENIKIIRPGDGLAPEYYDKIINLFAARDLIAGTALTAEAILNFNKAEK